MKKQAFTLVELIVVVTILAILATIGFVSYSGYLTGVRDTNRIASLTSISDGLELYRTKNDLPNPDDGINIQVNGVTIANQGYVGANVLQTIEYSKAGKDPKDDTYYSYYLTDDKKYYQLMAFLEEGENLETNNKLIGQANASINYSIRHPKVYGKRLGILTDTNNTPIQDTTNLTLNFTGGTSTEYISRFTDTHTLTASGTELTLLNGIQKGKGLQSSCENILQKNKSLEGKEAEYLILLNNEVKRVLCTMEGENNLRIYKYFDKVNNYITFPPVTASSDFELEYRFLYNRDDSYLAFLSDASGDSYIRTLPAPPVQGDGFHIKLGTRYSSITGKNWADNKVHSIIYKRLGGVFTVHIDGILEKTVNSHLNTLIFDKIGRRGTGDNYEGIIFDMNFKSGWEQSGQAHANPFYKLDDIANIAVNSNGNTNNGTYHNFETQDNLLSLP